ncbi:unnamed protein product [Amoebophrya sp. A120]|nr:unnamed protein product [Amoebophrya sp. A120]|eukprot:GSA120T00016064001.1
MPFGEITFTHAARIGERLKNNNPQTSCLIEIPGQDAAYEGVLYVNKQPIRSVNQLYLDIKARKIQLGKATTFEAAPASNPTATKKVDIENIHAGAEISDRGKECWLRTRSTARNQPEYVAGEVKELRVVAPDGKRMAKNGEEGNPQSYVFFDEFYMLDGNRRRGKLPMEMGWYSATDCFRRLSLLERLQRETRVCPLTRIVMEAPITDLNGYSKHTGPIFYTKDPLPRIIEIQKAVRNLLKGVIPEEIVSQYGSLPTSEEADSILGSHVEYDNSMNFPGSDLEKDRRGTQVEVYKRVSAVHKHGHAEEVPLKAVKKVTNMEGSSVRTRISNHKAGMRRSVHLRHSQEGEEAAPEQVQMQFEGEQQQADMASEVETTSSHSSPSSDDGDRDEKVQNAIDKRARDERRREHLRRGPFFEGEHQRDSFNSDIAVEEARYITAVIAKQHFKAMSEVSKNEVRQEQTQATAKQIDSVGKDLQLRTSEVKELIHEDATLFVDLNFDGPFDRKVICSECDPDGDNGYGKVCDATDWRRPWILKSRIANNPDISHPEFLIAPDGVHETDIRQHNVGDCWLTSILAACAYREDPEFVKRAITHVPEFGVFTFRIVVEGQIRWLLLDDRIPVDRGNIANPKFVSSATQGELWPVLIEKAFAKWAGCYQNLRGGMQNIITPIGSTKAMEALTAGSEIYELETSKRHSNPNNQILEPQMTVEKMLDFRGRNFLMTTSGCEGKDGLIPGHVFSILDVRDMEMPRGGRDGYVQFLQDFAKTPISAQERENEKVLHLVNETGCPIRFRHYSEETPTKWRGTVMQKTMKSYDFKLEGNHGKLKWCYETPTSGKNFLPDEVLSVRNGDTISFKQPNQVQGSMIRKMAGHADTAKMYEKCPAGQYWLKGGTRAKFVKIRNPWGHGEWTGLWADQSAVWDYYPEIAKALNFVKSDDGVFFLQWEDFDWSFGAATVCGHCHGSPLKMATYEHRKDFIKSPSRRKDMSYEREHWSAYGKRKGESESSEGYGWEPQPGENWERDQFDNYDDATAGGGGKRKGNAQPCSCVIM